MAATAHELGQDLARRTGATDFGLVPYLMKADAGSFRCPFCLWGEPSFGNGIDGSGSCRYETPSQVVDRLNPITRRPACKPERNTCPVFLAWMRTDIMSSSLSRTEMSACDHSEVRCRKASLEVDQQFPQDKQRKARFCVVAHRSSQTSITPSRVRIKGSRGAGRRERLDGVYAPGRDGGAPIFHPAPGLTQEDIEDIVERASKPHPALPPAARGVVTLVTAPGEGAREARGVGGRPN